MQYAGQGLDQRCQLTVQIFPDNERVMGRDIDKLCSATGPSDTNRRQVNTEVWSSHVAPPALSTDDIRIDRNEITFL